MLRTQLTLAAIAGWLLLNCLTVGAYQIYQAYRTWNFDAHRFVGSLEMEQRNELAEALFSSQAEYQEPVKKKSK